MRFGRLPLLFVSLFLLVTVILVQRVAAEDFFSSEVPVEITADYLAFDKKTGTYRARGSVVITQEGTTLTADSATMNVTTSEGFARGNVVVVDGEGNRLTGEELKFNIRKKTALVARGRIFYKKDNVYIEGETLKKTGPDTYEGEHLKFTSCDCPGDGKKRAWAFSVTSGRVIVGKYFVGRNAIFRIKGVPVLYSPFIAAPVKRKRQTGFLFPGPGYSELRGFVLDNAFFWAIARNADATFYLDVETARGLGEGIEFRYIRNRNSYGEAYFYHFRENDIDRVREFRKGAENLSRPESATADRWRLKLKHTEYLPLGFNIKADVDVVSDDEYFIDFAQDQERSIESLESNISISRNWSVYSLVAQFRVFDNLLVADESTTLRKLPEVNFAAADRKLWITPFYYSFDSSLINFSRDEGTTGQRLDLMPRISLPLSPARLFDFNASFTPRGTFYLVSGMPDGRYTDRYLYEVSADITTTFARVFFTGLKGLRAIKHTIRPKLAYTYIPEAVQDDLPSFDSVDRVAATNRVTYSLNTIFTGKYMKDDKPAYLDHIYFEVSQSFDINESTRHLTSATDKRRPFSEISAELILRPATWATITGKGSYNIYDRRFSSYYAEASASDSRGDSISISQRFVRDDTNFFEGSIRVNATRGLMLKYLERFSIDEGFSIESTYGVDYTSQCWGVGLTYSDRLEERVFYLTFNLKGIGSVGGVSGSIR